MIHEASQKTAAYTFSTGQSFKPYLKLHHEVLHKKQVLAFGCLAVPNLKQNRKTVGKKQMGDNL